MGVVYEAVEEALGRTVALKVVAPERVREEGFRERFVAESRMAASLDHPNVLPVFGAGETEDGMLWLSMRLVVGADLRSLGAAARRAGGRDRGPGRRGAGRRARAAARAPRRQARQRARHRLRPRVPHRLRAREGARSRRDLTRTGEVVGTLDYIAPERIRGAGDGPAADLYSLGCLLYVALTGRPVFDVEGTEPKLWAHLSEPPPAVPGFEAVLARALAKEPAERFESGAALGAAAIAAATSSDVTAVPAPVLDADSPERIEARLRAARDGRPARQAASASPRWPGNSPSAPATRWEIRHLGPL